MKISIGKIQLEEDLEILTTSIFTKKEFKKLKKASKGHRKDKVILTSLAQPDVEFEVEVGDFIDMLKTAVKISDKEINTLIKFGAIEDNLDIFQVLMDHFNFVSKKNS